MTASDLIAPGTVAAEVAAPTAAGGAESPLARQVARRRTFAIISHPDAGKTTLTEKLLLYSGAVELAGAVRGRKSQRHARSDWMAMERERGISITSAVLQFEYRGHRFNLLDTPGHQDFSEDTYRTLLAADSAVMVLDSARGIEPQTLKLFEVCRQRRLPLLTFINKLDRPGNDPLSLLDEIERVLGLGAVPLQWPIGTGTSFRGVYDRVHRRVLRFERTERNQFRAPVIEAELDDPALDEAIGAVAHRQLQDDDELLSTAGAAFDRERFLAAEVTPVFFGSALTGFGVGPFLDALVDLAPPPGARPSDRGPVSPTEEAFSGFVFKIQANLDPRHRDRMAFLRVCAGRFEKDMLVHHARLGRTVRMARPHRLFAQERETVEEAFPGDVVGLVNPGLFAIGDSLSGGEPLSFEPMPRFAPEHFGVLRNRQVARYKQFHNGLTQLEEEGAVQIYRTPDGGRQDPILAAVGTLQFEVVVARLREEYGVDAEIERLAYVCARTISGPPAAVDAFFGQQRSVRRVIDHDGRTLGLFASEWAADNLQRQASDVVLGSPAS
jgi:peptide chain release factor 3